MKSSRLLLLLLVLLLAGGAAFLALREKDATRPDPAPLVVRPEPPSPPPIEPVESAASEPEEEQEREAVLVPEVVEPAPVRGAENFDLDGARFIRGRVAAPIGAPPDLSLEVVAVAIAPGEVLIERDRPLSGDLSVLEALEADGRAVSRRSVSLGLGAGAYELPVPPTADRAVLFVDGHYMHLKEAEIVQLAELDESSPPIVLEAELGTFLRIVVFPPEGVAESAIEGARVMLQGFLDGDMMRSQFDGAIKRREAPWIPGEPIEWRGLPEGLRVIASASHTDYLDASEMVTRLLEARDRTIELRLELGEILEGRVVDEEGFGVAEATILIRVEPSDSSRRDISAMFFNRTPSRVEVITQADGSFAARGLEEGTARLRVTKSGWTQRSLQEVPVPGEEPLAIALSRGKRLAGRVQWPDGKPAVAASISVRSGGSNGIVAFGETNLQGRFMVSGLGEGSLLVHAELDRRKKDGGRIQARVPTLASRLRSPALKTANRAGFPQAFLDESRMTETLWRATKGPVPPDEEALLTLEEPCTVHGRVVDGSGEPVETFDILCEPNGAPGWKLARPDAVTAVEASVSGEFEVTGLSRGNWLISVSSGEYLPSEDLAPITLPSDEPLTLTLQSGFTVLGVVTDPFGQPVEGAQVMAAKSGGNRFEARFRGTPSAETEADGSFRMPALALGSYDLFAEHEDWAGGDPFLLELMEDEDPPEVELVLTEGGKLEGVIYDREGVPEPDRPIQLFSMGAGSKHAMVSDTAGRFSEGAITPGTYQVLSEPTADELQEVMGEGEEEPGPAAIVKAVRMASVEIREGETSTVVLGEPPTEPVRVLGSVLHDSEPVSSGFVMAIPEGKDLLTSARPTNVSAEGRYELTLDAPGEIVLLYQGVDDIREGIPFPVRVPEGVADFEYDLELPLSGITGTVRSFSGEPIQGVRVRLATGGGTYAPLMAINGGPSARTDAEGRYSFQGVQPREDYVVRAGGNGIFGLAQRSDLIVREDTLLDEIDFNLRKPGRITGTVLDRGGEAVRGASIFVRDERGRPFESLSRIVSDPKGQFEVDGVAGVATYSVFARTSAGTCLEPAVAVVRPGEEAEVTLVIEPGTLLRVALRDAEGDPIRANLSVRDEDGFEHAGLLGAEALDRLMTEGISSSDLTIGPLAPGKYSLVATTTSGKEAKKRVNLNGREERRVKLRFKD